jgi:alpha-glucosidase
VSDPHAWWEDAVVYEVYPRSFADSNEDGVGDLNGVRLRLGYLADLGVDAIWLTPFYPSPLADGGYDVSDYRDVDPLLGTLADFDALIKECASHGMRVIVDLVPNHCSAAHPLFRAALAAAPGSPERDLFMFRDGRGPDGSLPPNNWRSAFGGAAWTRVTDGQWYLHLFDPGQPDWNWANDAVPALFADVIRFWLDRGAAGLRVDVASAMFKDPALPDDIPGRHPSAPSGHRHLAELHTLYSSWREILDSYPADEFPGRRTAVGEVWYDVPGTLEPYLQPGCLPQVFNFQLLEASWDAAGLRAAVDAALQLAGGSRAPWVIGNHDVPRPVTRYALNLAVSPDRFVAPASIDPADLAVGARRARAAALLQLALPGSAYIYQGEELGLPEVLGIPDQARQDPTFRRTGGRLPGRDGCRVPLPWSADQPSAPSWLPQPDGWGRHSVATQSADPDSFLTLYRTALRLRREHPALGSGILRWLDGPAESLVFAREPGFVFAANLGTAPVPLPPHRELLVASGPLAEGGLADGAPADGAPADRALPPDTAVWLSA